VLTGGVLAYLLWTPDTGPPDSSGHQRSTPEEVVRLAGPRCIFIKADSPLHRKLQVGTVKPVKITAPALNVTGLVAASLRPGHKKGPDHWQFNSSELLTAFTDWQKATADIAFAETQLAQIKQLADTRLSSHQKHVARMKKLVEAGTDTEKDLAAAEAELIQSQIQGRKEVHEAETAVRLARRTEAALARQLQQAGMDPELLQSANSDLDIVMADVPEGMMSRVKLGQGCAARFFGFPNQVFAGRVRAIAPVLSRERRSLRVLFAIDDPQDQLRPGMFADIGLGTDARDSLLVPPEGVVHVGRSDYLISSSSSTARPWHRPLPLAGFPYTRRKACRCRWLRWPRSRWWMGRRRSPARTAGGACQRGAILWDEIREDLSRRHRKDSRPKSRPRCPRDTAWNGWACSRTFGAPRTIFFL
jgi:hypothetical protein